MIKKYISLASLLFISFLLNACTQPEIPEDRFYRLKVGEMKPSVKKVDAIIAVDRFRADGLLSARPLIFINEKNQLSQYHYHFWVESPIDLLQDELVRSLRESQIATHIVTPELRVEEDYFISGKIKRLERVLTDAQEKAVVELELGVKHQSDSKIIVLKTYRYEQVQLNPGIDGLVEAMNLAISHIYNEFISDLSTAL